MATKLVYKKPSTDHESSELLIGLTLHEADDYAPVPGGLYGDLALRTETGAIVISKSLTPDDLKPLVGFVDGLKAGLFKELGVQVEEVEEPEPKEEETEP